MANFFVGTVLLCIALGILVPELVPSSFGVFAYALSLLDTIAHELGHIIFGYLGEFIGILGGTIGQLIPPLAVLASAYRNKIPIAAACSIFWLGQNFIHMSSYIADARELKLEYFQWWAAFGGPVMKQGDPKHHDWHNILGTLHLLWADRILANLAFLIGVLLMLGSMMYLFLPASTRMRLIQIVLRKGPLDFTE